MTMTYTYGGADLIETAIRNMPNFKCYACLRSLRVTDFGRFFLFNQVNDPKRVPVCRQCNERLSGLTEHQRTIKLNYVHENMWGETLPQFIVGNIWEYNEARAFAYRFE